MGKNDLTRRAESKENQDVNSRLDAIIRLLNVMIRLTLDQQIMEKKAKRKDQLLSMNSAGLTTGDIANILGKQSKDVSSFIKKAKKHNNHNKKPIESENNEQ